MPFICNALYNNLIPIATAPITEEDEIINWQ